MERLRHLVVVLPGILGSVLEDQRGHRVWGPGLRGTVGTAGVRPWILSVAENPRLVPVGLLPSIAVVPPVFRVPGYDQLVRLIQNQFADVVVDTAHPEHAPVGNADVVLVPYDFRVGIEAAAEQVATQVNKRLEGLLPSARRRRVIVVAHSMGGLVARYWLGPGGGAADCAALITIGTPHGGAPKALDYLVNGVRLGPRRFRRLTELARGWRSVYDLLPRYPAVELADGSHVYPHELDGVGVAGHALAAYRTHVDIDDAWAGLDDRPDVLAMFSRGHATPLRAAMADGGLSVTKKVADWLPNPGWAGDGTVPADSAIPHDLTNPQAWLPVPHRHLPMAGAPAVLEVLRNYAGVPTTAMRGSGPEQPWLGLDLEETYPAGHPVRLCAELLGASPDETTTVWATAQSVEDPEWRTRVRADRVGNSWAATLPPLPAGTYQLRVDAVGVPGVDQVRCTDVLGVVPV